MSKKKHLKTISISSWFKNGEKHTRYSHSMATPSRPKQHLPGTTCGTRHNGGRTLGLGGGKVISTISHSEN
jgi:hypothetical protein